MLKETIFAGLVFFAVATAPTVARAAESQNDPTQARSAGATVDNLTGPSEADAAAVAAIEPAAGGGNIFTATLDMDARKKANKHSQDPDPQATAAEKTRRANSAGVQ